MKTIPLKTLLGQITPLPWNGVPAVPGLLHSAYLLHAANHFPELVEAMKDIASDCEDIAKVEIVSAAEKRTWKSTAARIRAIILAAETVQIED